MQAAFILWKILIGLKKQEMANTSLKENRTHGTVQYPVALYEWNGENEWHVVPHWHEEMEWIYFQKGDFPVWINTKEYQVHAPAFMCIHPEELHALILEKDGIESAVVFPVDILCFERYDAAADVVLCRAGASTISELTALGKPTVMVPSPYVTNNHQEKNARLLEKHGGAVVITEPESTGDGLYKAVEAILSDNEKRTSMARAMKELGIPDATARIYDTVMALVRK